MNACPRCGATLEGGSHHAMGCGDAASLATLGRDWYVDHAIVTPDGRRLPFIGGDDEVTAAEYGRIVAEYLEIAGDYRIERLRRRSGGGITGGAG